MLKTEKWIVPASWDHRALTLHNSSQSSFHLVSSAHGHSRESEQPQSVGWTRFYRKTAHKISALCEWGSWWNGRAVVWSTRPRHRAAGSSACSHFPLGSSWGTSLSWLQSPSQRGPRGFSRVRQKAWCQCGSSRGWHTTSWLWAQTTAGQCQAVWEAGKNQVKTGRGKGWSSGMCSGWPFGCLECVQRPLPQACLGIRKRHWRRLRALELLWNHSSPHWRI